MTTNQDQETTAMPDPKSPRTLELEANLAELELLEQLERDAHAVLRLTGKLPAWGRNGQGIGTSKVRARRQNPTAADLLELAAEELHEALARLEAIVEEWPAYVQRNQDTATELTGYRRDVAAMRRLLGTEPQEVTP